MARAHILPCSGRASFGSPPLALRGQILERPSRKGRAHRTSIVSVPGKISQRPGDRFLLAASEIKPQRRLPRGVRTLSWPYHQHSSIVELDLRLILACARPRLVQEIQRLFDLGEKPLDFRALVRARVFFQPRKSCCFRARSLARVVIAGSVVSESGRNVPVQPLRDHMLRRD